MFRSVIDMITRFVAPHLCPVCDTEVTDHGLCSQCWTALKFISNQACHQCGSPFDIPMVNASTGHICGQCLIDPPDFDHAVSAMVYADPARHMILALKHGDRHDITPILAQLMAPKTLALIDQADVILPLPLHRTRFLRRRFNQSAELTRQLLALHGGGKTMATTVLIRQKATPPQGHKSKAQRIAAMRGAFYVPPNQRPQIKDKSILIIDDVLTTGASLSSAARCLKRAGISKIMVSTVARVC